MRGVENSGVRSHDFRSQHLTAIKIAEIQPEIFETSGAWRTKVRSRLSVAGRGADPSFADWLIDVINVISRSLRHLFREHNPDAHLALARVRLHVHHVAL